MKNATVFIRVLIGLLLLYASSCFFLKISPESITTGEFKAFQVGDVLYSYLMPFANVVELLCAIAFLSGRYVTLANIVVLPITINILLINFFITPQTLPVAIFLFLGNLLLIYRFRDNYKPIFTP